MIRLLRNLGSLPAGTETDLFDAAAEAAFLLDGTAERIGPGDAETKAAAFDYGAMGRDELLRIASERGLEVRPRAAKREIAEALAEADEA